MNAKKEGIPLESGSKESMSANRTRTYQTNQLQRQLRSKQSPPDLKISVQLLAVDEFVFGGLKRKPGPI
jgi:hypothetical protein